MAINGVGHNYDYFGTTTNYIRGKATVREAISKTVKQSANLSISDAGRNMLRQALPVSKDIILREKTAPFQAPGGQTVGFVVK